MGSLSECVFNIGLQSFEPDFLRVSIPKFWVIAAVSIPLSIVVSLKKMFGTSIRCKTLVLLSWIYILVVLAFF